jgi:Zn-dependent protease
MLPTREGSFRLFRFAGIDLYLHWSWFLVAAYVVFYRRSVYGSPMWNALEYLALFLIVMLHEFGHALACRQVGGRADQIVLWPLGGVAYVDPPPRPGPTLWSIAAGPLVNVLLVPVFELLLMWSRAEGLRSSLPDFYTFLQIARFINIILLVFNLLPIYPLDGGQIFQCLLWFVVGRARSLLIAAAIGMVGGVGLIGYALLTRSIWVLLLAVFMMMNCWSGLRYGLALGRAAKLPRRNGFSCPACHEAPRVGRYWTCSQCRNVIDIFETQGECPFCGAQYSEILCPECGETNSLARWVRPSNAPPRM